MNKITDECNEFEKELMDSVVDPSRFSGRCRCAPLSMLTLLF
jgi:hypothetical protein